MVMARDRKLTQKRIYEEESFPKSYLESVRANIAPYVRGRVLDIGGHDGALLDRFTRGDFYVVDLVDAPLKRAREKGYNARKADMHSLPFEGDFFDTVIMVNVLEHSPDPLRAMREAKRILKKGGRAVIDVPNARSIRQLLNLLKGDPLPSGNSVDFDLEPNHYFQYTSRQLEKIVSLAGLKAVRCFGKKPVSPVFNFLFRLLGDGLNRVICTDIILVAEKN